MPTLLESRQLLERAAAKFQTLPDRGSPFMLEAGAKIAELLGRQRYLEQLEASIPAPEEHSQLGLVPLLIGGAVLSIGALSAWVYKQHSESQRMDAYLNCLAERQAEGYDAKKAASICYPFGGLVGSLTKAGIVLAGLTLLYFVMKM